MNRSCLAHIINLATQALIGTYSKSPYFDPKHPDAHLPMERDEIGLVRSIVVKVWISMTSSRIMTGTIANMLAGTLLCETETDVENHPN